MPDILTMDDLPASLVDEETISLMLDGANAKAARVAPCLAWDGSDETQPAPTLATLSEARLILLGAVKRWVEAGSGAFSQKMEVTGPFSTMESVDTRQKTGFNLWPSEITDLQNLCRSGGSGSAFSIDTAPSCAGQHLPWCSLNFGATYCSCGVDIAGYPIFETG